jgi:hypothetical protein
MANITIINHGTVNIYEAKSNNTISVEQAKDELLTKMYYARNKNTMGGYQAWLDLLDMYYSADWQGMCDHIGSYKGKGKGGKTRHDCLKLLEVIMKGE